MDETPHAHDTISVVIPAYNVEPDLQRCIDSILRQDHEEIEIIVADDGSDDGTLELARSLAEKDARIRVYHQQNTGRGGACNLGLSHASGAWVTFVDADDLVCAGAFRRLLDAIEDVESGAPDIVVGDFIRVEGARRDYRSNIDCNREIYGPDDREKLQRLALSNIGFTGKKSFGLLGSTWAKLYNRPFIEARKLKFDVSLRRSQDILFNLAFFEAACFVQYVKTPVYEYCINRESVTYKADAQALDKAKTYFAAVEHFMAAHDAEYLRQAYYRVVIDWIPPVFSQLSDRSRKAVSRICEDTPFAEAIRSINPATLDVKTRLEVALLRAKCYEPIHYYLTHVLYKNS